MSPRHHLRLLTTFVSFAALASCTADLEGGRYGLASTSILAGAPGVAEQLGDVVAGLGEPSLFER